MSVRWYRGAIKKTRRLKRQKQLRKPKSPKTTPKTVAPNLFKPRTPGVPMPGVHMPFVSTAAVRDDGSAQALGTMRYFADTYGWKLKSTYWKLSSENTKCETAERVNSCSDVAAQWKSIDSWGKLDSMFPGNTGMFRLTHPNCTCHIEFVFVDADGREISFEVHPGIVAGSDIFSDMPSAANITLAGSSEVVPPAVWDSEKAERYTLLGPAESSSDDASAVQEAGGPEFIKQLAPGETAKEGEWPEGTQEA